MSEEFTTAVVERCRWARAHNQGHPLPSWSTAEQVAVALVLRDTDHLAAMGYTVEQAADRVCAETQLSAFGLTGWLNDTRAAVRDGEPG
ncbi:hypothetical protein [Haloactinomyces albus]|uniref:Uncharacterized protein n=1 Tax=Haloactinomyces albus TaxID=1352928 RepID=A0AAE3Z7Q1_9ACTN|nr:hypothetical protein [Haloactinomyces albus]MDR7299867.1 hypothetical protein [Haloactinomyces albus]